MRVCLCVYLCERVSVNQAALQDSMEEKCLLCGAGDNVHIEVRACVLCVCLCVWCINTCMYVNIFNIFFFFFLYLLFFLLFFLLKLSKISAATMRAAASGTVSSANEETVSCKKIKEYADLHTIKLSKNEY